MPRPGLRSRTLRRLKVNTPSGRAKIIYRLRKPQAAKCGSCGAKLHGMPIEVQSKFRNLSATKKRPNRMYGGNLCSSCSRKAIIQAYK